MGTLQRLGDDLWVADGPTAIDLLVIPYPTRMTIIRLPSGRLWLSSPVRLSYDRLQEVLDLGEPAHLVSATPRHHWRLEPWHALFPDATLWSCATGPFTLGKRTLPPRDIRAITHRTAGRAWAERVMSWDFDRLVMAHGPVVETGAKAYVERAFDWLLR